MTQGPSFRWDIFIAYARPDHAAAKLLHDRLARYATVFMDTEVLRAGDNWAEVTPAALLESNVVVVLVGRTLPAAHYLQSEILRSISSAQRAPDARKIVPVLLDQDADALPYGLERKHCLVAEDGDISRVVEEVLGLLLQGSKRLISSLFSPLSVNPEVKALVSRLEGAKGRLALLKESRVASQAVLSAAEKEVDELRRQLRAGGKLHPGDLLSEKYLLLETLGSGGFANVWLAVDRRTQEKVAVKVLRGDLVSDAVAYDRFKRGAKAMESLDHPHICKILSTEGVSREAKPYHSDIYGESIYYVMEYVPGGDLCSNVIKAKLENDRILSIINQAADALTCAHERGIVHRDIKPENILLTEAGDVKLTDFDLMLLWAETIRSRVGGLGTFIYSAPEQQDQSNRADARADIYSLGMTAIFAFYGGPLPLDVMHNTARFISELQINDAVKGVLRRAVAWDPTARYDSVKDFCCELSGAWKEGNTERAEARSLLLPEVDIEVVFVPTGAMAMGDDSAETSRPTHEVRVPEFWISRFPVTNAQYREFCEQTGHEPPVFAENERLNQPTQPVIGVSLGDAKAFCQWLLSVVSKVHPPWWTPECVVRLPSEAEWEYAARGPNSRTYPWGYASPNNQLANYGNACGAPTSVGNYPEGASWVSAQDMAGNVWEWCEDYWHDDYRGAPDDGSAWLAGDASKRVVRGGSFLFDKRGLAGHYRYWWHADKRQGNQGFRLVLSGIKPHDSAGGADEVL